LSVLPALFVSHGSPMVLLSSTPARAFLESLGQKLARPKAILVISSHWDEPRPAVTMTAQPETIHDFYGFPRPLYDITYPAPGSPDLARRVIDVLAETGIETDEDASRGLDHGAWAPLSLMWPKADIPVVQLAMQAHLGADHHMALGWALKPLRDEGVLILGTGSMTHNLAEFRGQPEDAPPEEWTVEFTDWFAERIAANDRDALVEYRDLAPHAEANHPTDEHLMPLFVAMGAGGQGERWHHSINHGVLAMDAYAFA